MSSSNLGPSVTTTGQTQAAFGNTQLTAMLSVPLSPVAVAANTTAEQTFTVTGLAVGDFAEANKPTTQAGLGIVNVRVSAANTLAIAFSNNTAGSITPTAAESYQVIVIRPTAASLSAGLPAVLPLV